jgi:hypothetical protein
MRPIGYYGETPWLDFLERFRFGVERGLLLVRIRRRLKAALYTDPGKTLRSTVKGQRAKVKILF